MSLIKQPLSWFSLLLFCLSILACDDATRVRLPSASNQALREKLQAIPLTDQVSAETLLNTGVISWTIPLTESEPIRQTMQRAWREVFLPTNPYQARLERRALGHYAGIAEYKVIAFDHLSATLRSDGAPERCLQQGEESYVAAPGQPGGWERAVSKESSGATGKTISGIEPCNVFFLAMLAVADPFDFRNGPASGTQFYRWTESRIIGDGEYHAYIGNRSLVNYSMVRHGVKIDLWLVPTTGQPVAMSYSSGQGEFTWQHKGMVNGLVIEKPTVP